jgi:hypothetical protein
MQRLVNFVLLITDELVSYAVLILEKHTGR